MKSIGVAILLTFPLLTVSSQRRDSLSDTVDRHTVFDQPLTQGVYSFDSEGFIPGDALKKVSKIHKEMMFTIQTIDDQKKQIKYLLTLANTANDVSNLKIV